jgi:hypothetical protein
MHVNSGLEYRWEKKIKTGPREMVSGGLQLDRLAQDRVQWLRFTLAMSPTKAHLLH